MCYVDPHVFSSRSSRNELPNAVMFRVICLRWPACIYIERDIFHENYVLSPIYRKDPDPIFIYFIISIHVHICPSDFVYLVC